MSEALRNRLHAAVVVVCAWLVFTSPWVSMLRRIPSGAGFAGPCATWWSGSPGSCLP